MIYNLGHSSRKVSLWLFEGPHAKAWGSAGLSTWYWHYNDVIMTTMASQITSLTVVYLTVYSDADQRKHQSSASLTFVRGIHRGPVNSPHKEPVTRKMFPFDDIILYPAISFVNICIGKWLCCKSIVFNTSIAHAVYSYPSKTSHDRVRTC